MNLPGPYQRPTTRRQEQGGSAGNAVVLRSRPLFGMPQASGVRQVTIERAQRGRHWLRHTPAWHASVWDEVWASANGVLLRRIRILITDEPLPGPEGPARG